MATKEHAASDLKKEVRIASFKSIGEDGGGSIASQSWMESDKAVNFELAKRIDLNRHCSAATVGAHESTQPACDRSMPRDASC